MKRFLIGSLFVTVLPQLHAQDIPENLPDVAPIETTTKMAPMPLQVRPGTQRMRPYDRIMYVLDVSCSMQKELPEAIHVTAAFASDSYKAAVITFADKHVRWKGVPEPCKHAATSKHSTKCLEPNWAWLPTRSEELLNYLASFSASGGTNPTSALTHAYQTAPAGTLIVFISDGGFTHETRKNWQGKVIHGPLAALKAGQRWRRKNRQEPIQMLVWATSEEAAKTESLVALAKAGGAGLWRADTKRSGP